MPSLLLTFIGGTIALSVPLLLAAFGETFSENAGMINLGMEGVMITGAFAGFWGTYVFSNVWMGLVSAALAGVAYAALVSFLCIRHVGDQAITGIAIWFLGVGLTTFLYGAIFPFKVIPPTVESPPSIPIPLLDQIPFLGTTLFSQDLLSYAAFLLFPIGYYVMYRTPLGVRLMAVGEDPRSADAAGISVYRYRYLVTVFGNIMTAVGGFFLSVMASNSFYPGMTSGRGFFALAIVILGRWNPLGVLVSALFFGSMLELQFIIEPLGVPIPYDIILTLPYILTVVFLVGFSRGANSPSAMGRPYKRGS